MPDAAIARSLAEACERWADRPAVTDSQGTLTYAHLRAGIDAVEASWRGIGVRPGDRIVCQLPTCAEQLVVMAAAWRCDAVHVPVHRDTSPDALAAIVRDVQ